MKAIKRVPQLKISMFVTEMSQLRREDAGNTGATFYQVTLQPGSWYKWFRTSKGIDEKPDNDEKGDDSGWTEVKVHLNMPDFVPCAFSAIPIDIYSSLLIHRILNLYNYKVTNFPSVFHIELVPDG